MMNLLQFFESLIQPFASAKENLKAPQADEAPPKRLLPFLWFYARQAKGLFIALLIIGFLSAYLEILLFTFIGDLVDMVGASPSPAEFFSRYQGALIWMLFIILVARPLVSILHDLLMNQALTTNFTSLIRWQQHRYLLRQSVRFFHDNLSGGIANRVMHTGRSLRDVVVSSTNFLWRVVVYALTTVVLFASLNIWLTLPLIIWLILYGLMLRYFLPKTRARSHLAARSRSRLMGYIVDSYSNITTLKLFSHSEREEEEALKRMAHQTRTALDSTRLITGLNVTLTLLNSLLIGAMVVVSLLLWQRELISAGAIAFALSLIIRINSMSTWIMGLISGIFENIGSLQDGIPIMTHPHEIRDAPHAKTLVVSAGAIHFNNIEFNYHKKGATGDNHQRGNNKQYQQPPHYQQGSPIYKGFTLALTGGEKIGLVGPSGAGKSTLVNLLLRLYEVQAGEITIDDTPITDVTQESLRGNIGVVTQDTALLHRSIRENLLYGNPTATDAELWEILQETKADEFVKELIDPYGNKGLDALVGENGVKLSGGQRQRIAIARVLLKNAPILILDEATSALDSESEAVIQEYLGRLMAGKTVIAIAHRLSTVAQMDRLVVIDEGRIVEEGTHQALVNKEGLYASLWHLQKGHLQKGGEERKEKANLKEEEREVSLKASNL